MLDQDTARALLTIADEHGARVALVGDRHQLPAVGRGGVLDLAARRVDPDAHLTLDTVHRFVRTTITADGTPGHRTRRRVRALSLAMRTGQDPAARVRRAARAGADPVHASDADRLGALADTPPTPRRNRRAHERVSPIPVSRSPH